MSCFAPTRNTPWQHVQWLMTIMAEEKLFKLQFATKKFADGDYPEKEGSRRAWVRITPGGVVRPDGRG